MAPKPKAKPLKVPREEGGGDARAASPRGKPSTPRGDGNGTARRGSVKKPNLQLNGVTGSAPGSPNSARGKQSTARKKGDAGSDTPNSPNKSDGNETATSRQEDSPLGNALAKAEEAERRALTAEAARAAAEAKLADALTELEGVKAAQVAQKATNEALLTELRAHNELLQEKGKSYDEVSGVPRT